MDLPLPSALWIPFGLGLARARASANISRDELAKRIGVPVDLLTGYERGERRPSRVLAERIDTALGTGDLVRGAWASTLQNEAFPRQYQEMEALEVHATRIWEHQPLAFPECLRTRDYARAVLTPAHPDTDPAKIEQWVDTQMRRRAALTAPGAPHLTVALNEEVLQHPQGGPHVLNAQRESLAALVADRIVDLYYIPRDTPDHPGLGGAFQLMTFTGRPTLVYAYHALGGTLTADPEEVSHCEQLVDAIQAVARPLSATSPLLTERLPC